MTEEIQGLSAVVVDEVGTQDVAAGITRRGLPGGAVAARAFDFAAGATWPEVDNHSADELIYVVHGELLDNGARFPAGSFLHYQPGSSHRPAADVDTRILVFGLAAPR
ncbi:cupin domain-containing protein [Plantactinospora sp. GCM10030261]|uniref:cupin domain-containing protein n=1 Tax=Plantactinospora sp. GCM10030261 TaxID=3273420 RepID=UPI00360B7642